MILLFTAGSCKKYLDVAPDSDLTEDDVFSSYIGVRGYMDKCYSALSDMHNWQGQSLPRNNINALSDEMGSLFVQDLNRNLNTGDWYNKSKMGEVGWDNDAIDKATPEGNVISNAFICLRIANKVIEKIDQVPGLSGEQRGQLLGQAHFFRAWYYFEIIKRWGGMPIFDKAYSPADNLDLPRVSYHESSEWLISDLDKAVELLPHVWPSTETGRATKASAMAVKEMAALYDASPLMQNEISSIVQKDYNIERAKLAAKYANDLIKYIKAGTGGIQYRLMTGAEYKNIFYSAPDFASDESLWYRHDAGRRNASRDLRVHYIPQIFSGGTGNDAAAFSPPTQNAVDMYEVIKGGAAYPVNDPANRGSYNPQKPYLNRDPRFYNNIIVPGEEWGVNSTGQKLYMEMYVGGRDFQLTLTNAQVNKRMTSGYVPKKYIWPEANTFIGDYTKYRVNTIYIRVSQVYLDYAEAMNEAYGPNSDPEGYGLTAVQAINLIRNRVGMPNVLPEYTTDKVAFRDRIRNERGVELQFENHRWFDLRRWMIAEDVFSRPIRGVRATPPANHKTVANKSTLAFTYSYVDLVTEQRVFQKRHYWYPLPANHVDDLFNLAQNPGW